MLFVRIDKLIGHSGQRISNRLPWKLHVPYDQRANGTVLIGVGVNYPWGAVNLWGGQHYYSLDF